MTKATITVTDECNCKITGLDTATRKLLHNKFKYQVPGAYFMPSVKLGRWDGTTSIFQMGGGTFVNLLPEILEEIQDHYDLELNDRRQYDFEYVKPEPITADSYSHLVWPPGHPVAGQPIILRDYQVDIINGFLNDPQSMQEVATGAGKTLVTAVLSHVCEAFGRTIVIVPNKSLVTQTEEDYINMGLDVGVFFGDRKEWEKTHTICTWQSLGSLRKKTGDLTIDDLIRGVQTVIVDEAHGAKAAELKDILTGDMAHIPIRWGLTGTIPKEELDKRYLQCAIGFVTNEVTAKSLQDKGVLAQCHVNIAQLIDIVEYPNYQSELKYLLTDDDRQDYLVKMINEISQSGNTLVLVDRVAAGQGIADKLNDPLYDTIDGFTDALKGKLPKASFVSGAMKGDKRKEHYDDIKTNDNRVIVATYGVAAVGINLPRIFNLVLLEPGKSFVRVIQSIGRGIRKAEDKDFVQVWDITSTAKFAKRHLTQRKKFYKEVNYPFTIEKVDWK